MNYTQKAIKAIRAGTTVDRTTILSTNSVRGDGVLEASPHADVRGCRVEGKLVVLGDAVVLESYVAPGVTAIVGPGCVVTSTEFNQYKKGGHATIEVGPGSLLHTSNFGGANIRFGADSFVMANEIRGTLDFSAGKGLTMFRCIVATGKDSSTGYGGPSYMQRISLGDNCLLLKATMNTIGKCNLEAGDMLYFGGHDDLYKVATGALSISALVGEEREVYAAFRRTVDRPGTVHIGNNVELGMPSGFSLTFSGGVSIGDGCRLLGDNKSSFRTRMRCSVTSLEMSPCSCLMTTETSDAALYFSRLSIGRGATLAYSCNPRAMDYSVLKNRSVMVRPGTTLIVR